MIRWKKMAYNKWLFQGSSCSKIVIFKVVSKTDSYKCCLTNNQTSLEETLLRAI